MKLFQNLILQHLVEIDHHVSAEDKVELVENLTGDQIILSEDDIFQQVPVENGLAIFLLVVVAQCFFALKPD